MCTINRTQLAVKLSFFDLNELECTLFALRLAFQKNYAVSLGEIAGYRSMETL